MKELYGSESAGNNTNEQDKLETKNYVTLAGIESVHFHLELLHCANFCTAENIASADGAMKQRSTAKVGTEAIPSRPSFAIRSQTARITWQI